ncbi:hypothetical protein DQ04_07481020 [Trypanosoma grayi]|uniref:hypothetical protein n=1 Tax=Trypanosoma grayi TaxID=71804 RepID=UPI0004F4B182|nr:hypothetical protein DQ04_07481020 [Trypanosoma grayi]KEG08309.1 hypothetical protein DQ04_07481020 [Trypanosoma grayi]
MIFFGQLVCDGCRKVLTYPLGAISCRCRGCGTVNAAQNLRLDCGCCGQSVLVPINTLTFLCPCCATVTDIPKSLLPRVEEPVDLDSDADKGPKTIYVSYPVKRAHVSRARTTEANSKTAAAEPTVGLSEGRVVDQRPLPREGEANDERPAEEKNLQGEGRQQQREHPVMLTTMVVGTRIL